MPKKSSSSSQTTGRSLSQSRIEKYYNKIVIAFVVVTLVLLGIILYFSFSKTLITIHAAPVQEEMVITATLQDAGGTLLFTDAEGSKEFSDFTSTVEKPGKATGTVTLVNKYSQSQPLVETTRLLSKEGVLFRTQETVTVPAGGSVTVPVIADEEGAKGDIGPSEFEVVALWEGLKDDIYGTSSEPMTGGIVATAAVSSEDITTAREILEEELAAQSKEIFLTDLENREGLPEQQFIPDAPTFVESLQEEVSAKEGDEVSQFTISKKETVALPVLDREKMNAILAKEATQTLPPQRILAAPLNLEDATFTLTDMNEERTDATLTFTFLAETVITEESELIDSTNFTGKTAPEIQTYLQAFDEIQSVDVQFSPFWMKKTPRLADRITVVVQ